LGSLELQPPLLTDATASLVTRPVVDELLHKLLEIEVSKFNFLQFHISETCISWWNLCRLRQTNTCNN